MNSFNAIERRLLDALESVEDSDGIEVIDGDVPNIGSSYRELLPLVNWNEEWRNVELDQYMLDSAPRFSGLSIWWETESPLPKVSGEFRVLGAREVLGQGPDPAIMSFREGFQREFVSDLRVIDHAFASSRGNRTLVRMSANTSPLEIWYYELIAVSSPPYPTGFARLDLSYQEYMEFVALARGLHGWQLLFADAEFDRHSLGGASENLRNGIEVLSEIFPDEDYSILKQRLEERL